MHLHICTVDVRQSNRRKKVNQIQVAWAGQCEHYHPLLRKYDILTILYRDSYKDRNPLLEIQGMLIKQEKISFGQSECEGRNVGLNLCQMPSVMNKPNLYLVSFFFFNSEQGCDVTSSFFSLGADKSPRAIVCLFTLGQFLSASLCLKEGRKCREGWKGEGDDKT